MQWYTELIALHKELSARGLVVLAFPCNQFAYQEPKAASEVETCARQRYGVDFQMMEKVEVNGREAHPVYRWLRLAASASEAAPYLGWNFCLFAVGRDGRTVLRPHAQVSPSAIRADLETLLAAEM